MSSNHQSIFSPRYFALSIGIILSVMAVGFEGLSVTTIAPSIAGDLNGLSLFGWIFSTYLLAQIIGTLVVGRIIDRRGPAVPFTIALLLFIVGLIAAATSGDMYTMIGSRAMQGLGAGAMMTCVYTAISLSYPDELRAKILGAFGTAYVLPSMLGPYVAGLIADQWSWRFVFWGILPILMISALLSLPAFTKLKTPKTQGDIGASSTWNALLLTMGTGIFLVGLSMLPSIMGFVLVIIGLVLMIFPLRKLLPKGTLTLRRGMPAILATRGLFFAAYTSTQNFLVLALIDVKGITPSQAGLIVASAALSWCVIAYLQGRWDSADQGRGRHTRIILGVLLLAIGITIVFWIPVVTVTVAVIGQIIAGIGIGLAHPISGVVAFSQTGEGGVGNTSANLQFADSFTPGVVIGIGGSILVVCQAGGMSLQSGLIVAMGFHLLLIVMSLFASTRISPVAEQIGTGIQSLGLKNK
ncbi:MFS transporter [Paenibacillus sp. FSL R5-0887]|jgi:MFS family permease|uniref:MFS transporter n=2 Tax=Paenibacillus TaxID=44249 RepID=A0ABX3GY59_9BACL|nr:MULTISPECIES: MFS transporter [Paenibacillus]MDH6430631.1 MFS family permease [Paenibacillus sp. PastH-4]MDH6443622.1 MFS family permease [Paenibacillus sp. PastF-4]MDH6527531.1 MFS family permease [Paenibacillus sp. PastH-3]OMD40303.1 MFS transporter [Paenibacillus odorifer]OMD58052.1 MFS transporter [Paenibacillus odorifer]